MDGSSRIAAVMDTDLDYLAPLREALTAHERHEAHRHTLAELVRVEQRQYGTKAYDVMFPSTPRPITPANVAADMLARMMGACTMLHATSWGLSLDSIGASATGQVHAEVDTLFEVLDGRRPVVFITEGQQEALWHTDAEWSPLPQSVFPLGPVVILPRPIEFGYVSVRGFVLRAAHEQPRYIKVDPDVASGEIPMIDMLGDQTLADGKMIRNIVSGVAFTEPAEDAAGEGVEAQSRLQRFVVALTAAIEMFGVSDDAPPVVQSRAERRRQERAAAKVPTVSSAVSVRYLRDPRNRLAVVHKREATGRTVKPHWRKGHIRWIRTGSMSLPKDDRPRVRHLIPPVIVNAHLGPPSGVVAYRCQDPIDG